MVRCKCKSRILCPIALLLLVATLAVCLATSASAAEVTASGTCGDALTWQLTDDGVLTISGSGAMTDFTNPSVSSPVTPAPWYDYRASISSVVVNDGVTSIGGFAFYNCSSIADVSLPNTLISIGSNAFYGVVLTDIEFPSSLISIGLNAFRTSKFTSLVLPDSLETIGDYAFYSSVLTSLVLPDSLLSIGNYAFYNAMLTEIDFPSSLISIGNYAFYSAKLTEIEFPDCLTKIGSSSFYSSPLSSVALPSSLISIGGFVFYSSSISELILPASVTSVGYGFFGGLSIVDLYFLGNVPPSFDSGGGTVSHSISLQHIYVPSDAVDTYKNASGWSTYADYIVPVGFEGTFSSVDLSDFQKVYENGDYYLNRVFGPSDFSVGVPSSSVAFSFIDGVNAAYISENLKHFDKVFYIGDLVDGAYGWSCTASFTYTSTKSASYSGSIQLCVSFFDEDGQYITSYLGTKSSFKMASGTNTYSVSISEHVFPDNAVYVSFYFATPTFYNMNVTSLTADLDFAVRSEPVIPPVEPEVTDDFGGEVNYLRGQAATPLSVTATVTDDGTLSYQWYYIDSVNVDVAVPIDGATGTSYIPDTRSVGSRYYYCIVTNTLGELTASMYSDYAYVTVTRPELGDGYDIYDYKDYVAGSVVDGTDKTYTITFPMSGIYTELYGGLNGAYSLLDYYTGTDIYCDLPSSALANDEYDVRLTFFPLGSGTQYNVMKLRNVAQGIPASVVFAFKPDCDFYVSDSVMTLYWYDSDMNLIGTTEYDLSEQLDISSGQLFLSANFDFTYPGSAAYFTYSIDFPNFEPEENMDFSLQIITADLVMTFSMMEDISGSIGEVGDKVDQVGDQIGEVGDKIDDTNNKLDDILSGGEAGEELGNSTDQMEQGNEQLGGVLDDLGNASDALPDMPQDMEQIVADNIGSFNDSNISELMPWNDPDYSTFWNILLTPTLGAVSVALLLYFIFGKARSV